MKAWAYVRLPVICLKALRVKYCIKTTILPVLCGFGTWCITHREKYGLRVFENICSKEEVTEDGRKLRNEELHNLYSSSNIIRVIKPRRMRGASRVAWEGEKCIHALCQNLN
jgi:hypothetical protein